ncbi:MAG: hypothetical protein GY870_22100 [archaeon]|nr:hypothetical protein [archaeon]
MATTIKMADIYDNNQEYFQYVRKVCNRKKPLDCPQLISKTKRRFDLDLDTTKKILKGFLDSNLILVRNKQVSIDTLANTTRRRILSQVVSYPGSYINFLKKQLDIGSNQLVWHLSVLCEFKFIKMVEVGRLKAFGSIDTPEIDIILGCLMLKNSIRKLFAVLLENPEGKTQVELSEIMSMPRSTMTYWLKNLIKMNIVRIIKNKRPQKYCLNDDIIDNMIENVNGRLIHYNAL